MLSHLPLLTACWYVIYLNRIARVPAESFFLTCCSCWARRRWPFAENHCWVHRIHWYGSVNCCGLILDIRDRDTRIIFFNHRLEHIGVFTFPSIPRKIVKLKVRYLLSSVRSLWLLGCSLLLLFCTVSKTTLNQIERKARRSHSGLYLLSSSRSNKPKYEQESPRDSDENEDEGDSSSGQQERRNWLWGVVPEHG